MKRVRLVVAYDGTNYCGWQIQNNGVTIEGILNKTLSALLKESVSVIGASRTDSGVHAIGNVAVFDTENRMPADKISFALNQRLPADIRVQSSEEVPLGWHPRKQNCMKTYEYKIYNRKIEMPLERLYAYFCYLHLDVEKMKEAAAYFIGEHDFKSFCTARSQAEETVRTIYRLDVSKSDKELITIRICGSGFLYNMVRIIAGTLIRVGAGAYPPEHIREIIDARDRTAAGPKIAAKGLTLVSLEYETEPVPCIKGENRDWSYELIQTRLVSDGIAYLVVKRCIDEEWSGVLKRVIHQAVRNGASLVYVKDLEKDRLKTGDTFGFYQLNPAASSMKLFCSIWKEAGCKSVLMGENEGISMDMASDWYFTQPTPENLDFIGKNREKEVDTHG